MKSWKPLISMEAMIEHLQEMIARKALDPQEDKRALQEAKILGIHQAIKISKGRQNQRKLPREAGSNG